MSATANESALSNSLLAVFPSDTHDFLEAGFHLWIPGIIPQYSSAAHPGPRPRAPEWEEQLLCKQAVLHLEVTVHQKLLHRVWHQPPLAELARRRRGGSG